MKRLLCVFIFCLLTFFFIDGVFAQPVEGKRFELSTSASMWNVKYEGEETETVFNLPLRIGFFIYKGLEIEPELFLTIPEETEDTGYLILGNLAYNFRAADRLIVFVLGGAGYGNSAQTFLYVGDWGLNVTAFNFGAGMKFLAGDSAAVRIEYRFTKYHGEDDYWGELNRTDNNIFVGFSLFF